MTSALIRRGHVEVNEEGCVKLGVEVGIMLPQCLWPPEAGPGKVGFFSGAFRGSMTLPTP